jgi:hypothetical protein
VGSPDCCLLKRAVPQSCQSTVEEVTAKDQHGRPNEVQPQPMEQRTGDHNPHPCQDQQQTTEQTDSGEIEAVQPPVDYFPSVRHDSIMASRKAAAQGQRSHLTGRLA